MHRFTPVPGLCTVAVRSLLHARRGQSSLGSDKGCFGKNRIFFPDVPHRSRHVPGVIKHGPEVFFTRSDVYSHLRPNSFTPFSISQRSRSVAREKPCRSTPDASVSVLDTSWAPQTPIPAVVMLRTRCILTQDDYGSRYARRGATSLTDGVLSSIRLWLRRHGDRSACPLVEQPAV